MLKDLIYIFFFNLLFIANSYSNNIKITSDNLEIDREKNISKFSGNVYAHNLDLELWADELIIKINDSKNEIEQMIAEKNVKIINQGITATGESGEYSPVLAEVVLSGNVEVFEDNNLVRCDELFLDIKNSTSIMKSNASNKVEAYIISK